MAQDVPEEFSLDHVRALSTTDQQMYAAEHALLAEPMKSFLANNPEVYFVPPKRGEEWGTWEYVPGSYYDTTTGDRHPYWKDKDLPQPSRDIRQLRADFQKWGYCKVADAIKPAVVDAIKTRVLEQAEGERLAGIAQKTPSGQNINCCVNKGKIFEKLIEQHPDVVQGHTVVEQLVTEALGPGWYCTSLIAAISLHGGVPQALHQDQGIWADSKAPQSVNILSAITPIDETNGGTLVLPGSHRFLPDAVRSGRPVGKLPPCINLDAPAGCMVITHGQLLHGTGHNVSSEPRIVMLNVRSALSLSVARATATIAHPFTASLLCWRPHHKSTPRECKSPTSGSRKTGCSPYGQRSSHPPVRSFCIAWATRRQQVATRPKAMALGRPGKRASWLARWWISESLQTRAGICVWAN